MMRLMNCIGIVMLMMGMATTASADITYRITIPIDKGIFDKTDVFTGVTSPKEYSAPEGAKFLICDTDAQGSSVMGGAIIKFTKVPVAETTHGIYGILPPMTESGIRPQSDVKKLATTATPSGYTAVEKGKFYVIKQEALQKNWYTIDHGDEAGILSVPFKVQLTDGKITSATSVGPYYGYVVGMGREKKMTILGSVGLTGISLVDVNSDDTDAKFGVTLAGGVVYEPFRNNPFQIGLLLGWDHIGDESYKYDDKWWASIAVGFSFKR